MTAFVAFVCLVFGNACHPGSEKEVASTPDSIQIPDPIRAQVIFGDSVNRAFFWEDESILRDTADAGLRMDGLSVLYIEKAPVPFKLHTTLMDIDILEVPLLLRMDAFDKEAGQSLELFSGVLKVEKNYPSDFPSLDTLHAGDLYMINKDIDLSEKERLDDFSIQQWWETYAPSVTHE